MRIAVCRLARPTQSENAAISCYTARFHNINLQVVSGTPNSAPTNGLGNLIVGENGTIASAPFACSDGQSIDHTSCQANGWVWARNHRSGSNNPVVGTSNSYSQQGGFEAGIGNVVNGLYALVSGGTGNIANNVHSSVSGGTGNTACGQTSSVSDGNSGVASGNYSSVSGSDGNQAGGNGSNLAARSAVR